MELERALNGDESADTRYALELQREFDYEAHWQTEIDRTRDAKGAAKSAGYFCAHALTFHLFS